MAPEDDGRFIACLNYCMHDPETGYCLTCGRPPIEVIGLDNSRLAAMFVQEAPTGAGETSGKEPKAIDDA